MDRRQDRIDLMSLVLEFTQEQERIDMLVGLQKERIIEIREHLLSFPEVSNATANGGIIKFHLPRNPNDHWSWDCSKSPIDTCVYDVQNDPAKDHCLFCGQPYERK